MNQDRKILIAGAGVAGASLAIRLANAGFSVTLIERDKFPRHKLCGEFVSPEALAHFRELGVLDEIRAIGGERITETVFYSPKGTRVAIPSGWFQDGELGALAISRAAMDMCLLEKAKQLGVDVLEETSIAKLDLANGNVRSVKTKNKIGETAEIAADIFVDATGRARILAKQATPNKNGKAKFVAFKAHLKNAQIDGGVCEIYFFDGGYGGLTRVENGVANCCFIIRADKVKKYGNDVEKIFREVLLKNSRARMAMKDAEPLFDWIAVSIDQFGEKNFAPAKNLFAVGDAGAFIDPFTGSGMLMALESSAILSQCLSDSSISAEDLAAKYESLCRQKFRRRLLICRVMRYGSFSPQIASIGIFVLNLNKRLRHFVARKTRAELPEKSHNLPL